MCNWFGRCVHNGSKRMSTFSRHTTKFPYGEISIRRIGFYGEISVRRNIRTAKFPTAKYPYGEISLRRNFLTAKFPYGEISYGDISYGEISYGEISCHEISSCKFPCATSSSTSSTFVTHPQVDRRPCV